MLAKKRRIFASDPNIMQGTSHEKTIAFIDTSLNNRKGRRQRQRLGRRCVMNKHAISYWGFLKSGFGATA